MPAERHMRAARLGKTLLPSGIDPQPQDGGDDPRLAAPGGHGRRGLPTAVAALDEYGRRLGLAFQITDDLLDVRSDEATAGKRVGKDAAQGKLTFPGLLGVEHSAEYARATGCRGLRGAGRRWARRPPAWKLLARHVLERNR